MGALEDTQVIYLIDWLVFVRAPSAWWLETNVSCVPPSLTYIESIEVLPHMRSPLVRCLHTLLLCSAVLERKPNLADIIGL